MQSPILHYRHDCTGLGYDQVQFTLVDCPGHASLIRTIIGGNKTTVLAAVISCVLVECDHLCVILPNTRAVMSRALLLVLARSPNHRRNGPCD